MPDTTKQQRRNAKAAAKTSKQTSKNLKKFAKSNKGATGNVGKKAPTRAQQIAAEAGKHPKGMTSSKGHWVNKRGVWSLTDKGRKAGYRGRLKDNEDGSRFRD